MRSGGHQLIPTGGWLSILILSLAGSVLLRGQTTAPVVTQISPASVAAASGNFNLTVFGVNFQNGAYVSWGGTPLSTISLSSNQLTANVPANLIAAPGLISVSVVNPGGGQSNVFGLLISSPPVTITTNTLPSATAGIFYSTTLTASGGVPPYIWSATSALPAGLTLSSAGVITGTPSASGTMAFTVSVADTLHAVATKSFSITIAVPALSITTSTPLRSGTAGQPYSEIVAATGGAPPYRWLAGQGFPSGLAIDPLTGAITGTPANPATFNFPIQVTDAGQGVATRNFTLVINPPPLTITTVPPLFNGIVGTPYVQSFSASGGVPPYRWSILAGSTGGFTLDPNTGTLQGTPQSPGTFSFTIQVADSTGSRISKDFSFSITPPLLTVPTAPVLPVGTVGVNYSQTFSVVGGASPYTWALISGTIPGLSFSTNQGILDGVPLSAGTFNFTLQASDSAGVKVIKSFTLTVNPAPLRITSSPELPGGMIGSPYIFQMTATGGVPPYSWSANGLPDGLVLNPAAGVISGTLTAAGPLAFTVRIIDSNRTTAVDLFRITVNLPPAPPVDISGLPQIAGAAQQFSLAISLAAPFPSPVAVQAILNFAPDTGGGDGTIQFSSGGRVADFTVPQGATEPAGDAPLALQTGTVAGTISISLRLQAGGVDITPIPAPVITTRIERAAPVIRSARLNRNANGFDVEVIGFSTSREITQASFKFNTGPGKILQVSEISIPLETQFSKWFQDPAAGLFGSQFTMTQPFSIQGDANAVQVESVTLTNRLGSVTVPITQ